MNVAGNSKSHMAHFYTQEKRETMEINSHVQLFRITEIGTRLALSRSSVYREIEAGNLHAVRIGKSLRVSSDELDRYIALLGEQNSEVA